MLSRSSGFLFLFVLGLNLDCGSCEISNWSSSIKLLMKLYDGCQQQDLISCMKIKAINFFDRMERNKEIVLDENLSIVRDGPPSSSLQSLERMARNMGDNSTTTTTTTTTTTGLDDSRLNDVLLHKVTDFFNGHKIVFNLPKIQPDDIKEEVAEGRGKMKKMMSMMMMGLAMKKAAAIPMALGLLFLLAGKALIISKLALILTLIIALKKLRSSSK